MRLFYSITTLMTPLVLATAAAAQVTELPPASYDDFARIGMVTTAQQSCGATVDQEALNEAMVGAISAVAAAGHDANAAVQHLGTPEGIARIKAREEALRTRHGVAAEGEDALCAAIRAETALDPALAAMVKMP